MNGHQKRLKSITYTITFIFLTIGMAQYCQARNVDLYMMEDDSSEFDLTIEIFANVATEFLGSYDLVISFNSEQLQFLSVHPGTNDQLLEEPYNRIQDGFLQVQGVYKYRPKGLVKILVIHFETKSNCMAFPFELYAYGLMNKDRDLSIDITGFEITQYTIDFMEKKQQDNLPLVDPDTVELIQPLVGVRFYQEDLFINQLIATIGIVKTNQYQSDILKISRLAHHMVVEKKCADVIDIISCLQLLTNVKDAGCSINRNAQIGLDDILAHFQKIAFYPIDN